MPDDFALSGERGGIIRLAVNFLQIGASQKTSFECVFGGVVAAGIAQVKLAFGTRHSYEVQTDALVVTVGVWRDSQVLWVTNQAAAAAHTFAPHRVD